MPGNPRKLPHSLESYAGKSLYTFTYYSFTELCRQSCTLSPKSFLEVMSGHTCILLHKLTRKLCRTICTLSQKKFLRTMPEDLYVLTQRSFESYAKQPVRFH